MRVAALWWAHWLCGIVGESIIWGLAHHHDSAFSGTTWSCLGFFSATWIICSLILGSLHWLSTHISTFLYELYPLITPTYCLDVMKAARKEVGLGKRLLEWLRGHLTWDKKDGCCYSSLSSPNLQSWDLNWAVENSIWEVRQAWTCMKQSREDISVYIFLNLECLSPSSFRQLDSTKLKVIFINMCFFVYYGLDFCAQNTHDGAAILPSQKHLNISSYILMSLCGENMHGTSSTFGAVSYDFKSLCLWLPNRHLWWAFVLSAWN